MASAFETESELDEFISQFLAGTLPKSAWTHAAHVAVAAAWTRENPATALDRLRAAIPRYNEATGGQNTEDSGYHETLTCFWVERVAEAMPLTADSRLYAVSAVVARYSPCSGLFRDYYSFDVVRSREARRQWIPPDLLL